MHLFVLGSRRPFVEGLGTLLAERPAVRLVGKTTSPSEAIEACRRRRPDVALVDVGLPPDKAQPASGEAAAAFHQRLTTIRVLAEELNVRVLAVSPVVEDWLVVKVMMEGALGFMSRESPLEELIEAVRRVSQGQLVLSQRHFRLLMQRQAVRLSPREQQLVKLLRQGLSEREIAEQMGLKANSVRRYIERLRDKLGVRSREEIVLMVGQE